ncbi:MAG: crossover junction endodeoxyribonuclease RuvC [Actinomycetota bacterium]
MFAPGTPTPGRRGGTVLGVDPGLTRCGYAVLANGTGPLGSSVQAMAMGVIRTPASDPLPRRLAALHREIAALIEEHSPAAVAVEQVFFQNNVRTAMSVGQASGVILSLAEMSGCEVAQYTPSQVKDVVAGWGGAGKEQVQRMVQKRLGLSSLPRPADAADAAAIAICHMSVAPFVRSTALASPAVVPARRRA